MGTFDDYCRTQLRAAQAENRGARRVRRYNLAVEFVNREIAAIMGHVGAGNRPPRYEQVYDNEKLLESWPIYQDGERHYSLLANEGVLARISHQAGYEKRIDYVSSRIRLAPVETEADIWERDLNLADLVCVVRALVSENQFGLPSRDECLHNELQEVITQFTC